MDLPRSESRVRLECIGRLHLVLYGIGYAGYSFAFSEQIYPLRFAIYGIALLVLFDLVWNDRAVRPSALLFCGVYLGWCSIAFASVVADRHGFLVECALMLAATQILYLPSSRTDVRMIRACFLVSAAFFLISYILADDHQVRLFQILGAGTGSGLESGYDDNLGGLVGPIYVSFFALVGAKLELFLALIVSIVGGKRIGVSAILIGLSLAWIVSRHVWFQARKVRFWSLMLILSAINILSTNLLAVSDYLHSSLGMQVSIEEVMLGRHEIAEALTRSVSERPALASIVGDGAGAATATTTIVTQGTLVNPHNDWLKIRVDYGVVGSALITLMLALVFSSSVIGSVLAVMNGVIMMTDNVTIYMFYQFPLALMLNYDGAIAPMFAPRARRR